MRAARIGNEARRLRADGRQTREGILEHAVQLASREGLEALTIGRLAEALGMSKSGLFAHFGSKQGLQLAVMERASDIFGERVRKVGRRFEPGLERLVGLLEAWMAYVERCDFEGGFTDAHAEAAETLGCSLGPTIEGLTICTMWGDYGGLSLVTTFDWVVRIEI